MTIRVTIKHEEPDNERKVAVTTMDNGIPRIRYVLGQGKAYEICVHKGTTFEVREAEDHEVTSYDLTNELAGSPDAIDSLKYMMEPDSPMAAAITAPDLPARKVAGSTGVFPSDPVFVTGVDDEGPLDKGIDTSRIDAVGVDLPTGKLTVGKTDAEPVLADLDDITSLPSMDLDKD